MVNVYSVKGESKGKVELPQIFDTEYRPDLIQRAVVSIQANKRQRYGVFERAGLQTSADYFGRRRGAYRQTINKGMSRLPREKPGGGGLGKVRRVPHAVGGRRAHPPTKKIWEKKINNKEYLKALSSAIAATGDRDLITNRGHLIDDVKNIPLIVEDKFQKLDKTTDVLNTLKHLGLEDELDRAREKKIRAGKGKTRGRKYKKRKSVLIVVNEDHGIKKGSRNIPGVDIVDLNELNVELLAPGAHAGRLSLWTKSAIKNLDALIAS